MLQSQHGGEKPKAGKYFKVNTDSKETAQNFIQSHPKYKHKYKYKYKSAGKYTIQYFEENTDPKVAAQNMKAGRTEERWRKLKGNKKSCRKRIKRRNLKKMFFALCGKSFSQKSQKS